MNIVYTPNSQLCNKIWSIAGIIAHSIVYKEKVIIVGLKRYADLFPNLRIRNNVCVPPVFIDKILSYVYFYFLLKIKYKTTYNKNKKSHSLCFINGWDFRQDYDNLDIVYQEIIYLFSPTVNIKNRCEMKFNKERERTDKIIGIHLRRGDYKTYKEGIYYYDDTVMYSYMKQISILFSAKKIKFFIASNESVNMSSFIEFNCFTSDINSTMDDLFSLSLCDYILGPPSTFSMWASFYGKKPLRILDYKDEILTIDSFEVI